MDKKIKCRDCGNTFTLTVDEQNWFREKGLELPKRCKSCRQKRKQKGGK